MFGRMMNSYYYGKSGKGDYRKEDLPKNRWQLFWEMLRVRLSGICRENLMTCVFWLPMMLVITMMINSFVTISSFDRVYDEASGTSYMVAVYDDVLDENGNVVTKGTSTPVTSMVMTGLLMLVPCIFITGPMQAGMAYVMRNWARDEHAFAWSDFKDAVKDNWKQALGISGITGLLPLILYVGYNFYSGMQAKSALFLVPQMLMIVVGFVWFLALVFFYPLMVTYKMSFGQLVKNGLMLAVARLPQTIGIRLCTLIPTVIAVVVMLFSGVWLYALLALGAYYLIVGNAFSRFVFASFTNGVFDRFINIHIEGVEVNRGLATEEEDDDDEEEDEEAIDAQ